MTCKPYDIPKTLIWEAWLQVKANQGAAGIDTETIERFENKLGDNLYKVSGVTRPFELGVLQTSSTGATRRGD
jgi:RNA-directed DNA polymerase